VPEPMGDRLRYIGDMKEVVDLGELGWGVKVDRSKAGLDPMTVHMGLDRAAVEFFEGHEGEPLVLDYRDGVRLQRG
jgi:hypothetical protein